MNILFVCHRFPFPPNRGGKIRPFQMIRRLSEEHSVTVASLAHTEQELAEGRGLGEHCDEIIAEVVPNGARWSRAVGALLGAKPSSAAYFWSPRLQARIRAAAAQKRFDVLMVHCAFVAPYVGDIDSRKYFDYAEQRAMPLSWGFRLDGGKLRRFEKQLAARFDQCTVTTAGELDEFRKFGVRTPCRVIPNGVDFDYFRFRQALPDSGSTIVFLGRMDYYPNIDAVSFFVRDCLPLVQRDVPGARLLIVGSSPSKRVQELGETPGVTVTGHVPDVRPFLDQASVTIAPLRIARGTQNKILECMSAGVPVVSTSPAAKGIQATPGEHLLVADDPGDFAAQVVRVLGSRELQRNLAIAARRQVEAAHDWQRSLSALADLVSPEPAAPAQKPA